MLLSLWTEYCICKIDQQWKWHVHHAQKKVCFVCCIKRMICFILIAYNYTRKLRTGVWLLRKVGVEELDVLGEEYERPASSRK